LDYEIREGCVWRVREHSKWHILLGLNMRSHFLVVMHIVSLSYKHSMHSLAMDRLVFGRLIFIGMGVWDGWVQRYHRSAGICYFCPCKMDGMNSSI